jgi:hypothetical protein
MTTNGYILKDRVSCFLRGEIGCEGFLNIT